MGRRRQLDGRIGVGNPSGPRSSVWRVWSWRNDVYVAWDGFGGTEKISFHAANGLCRKAFTREHGAPDGKLDRATASWHRKATPGPGSGRGTCVLEICFPTDYLSSALEPVRKQVTWLKAAPPSMALVVQFFFTLEPEQAIRRLMGSEQIVSLTELPNGETFVISSGEGVYVGADRGFYVPRSERWGEDLIFAPFDPDATGRPVRFTWFSRPKDGESMKVSEFGGYKGHVTAKMRSEMGVFERVQVLDFKSR